MQAAKFLYRDESKARPDEGEKACEPHSSLLSVESLFPTVVCHCNVPWSGSLGKR